jgi:predicted amidohydrolase
MTWWFSFGLGLASCVLALAARRWPLSGWLALAPLALAVARTGVAAGLSGLVVGAAVTGFAMRHQPAHLPRLGVIGGGVAWGLAATLVGVVAALLDPRAGVLLVVPCALLATFTLSRAGAPRWAAAALACTQEPHPFVIRMGRQGGELAVTGLLAWSGAAVAWLVPGPSLWPMGALVTTLVLALVLFRAVRSIRASQRALDDAPRLRVAAVVVDGPRSADLVDPLWPGRSPAARDVEATLARYAPHVARAAAEGAVLVVLPEVAVVLEHEQASRTWRDGVRRWAVAHDVTIVAPHLDLAAPSNTLDVVTPRGELSSHDKQHPAPGIEPAPRALTGPGAHVLALRRAVLGTPLSTVICVDLDYADLVGPVRARRGLLAVPSNDWPGGFERDHDRTSVWAAVLTETSVIRATGHGLSSMRDGAGRLLARASSLEGPVVLVCDVPVLPDAETSHPTRDGS